MLPLILPVGALLFGVALLLLGSGLLNTLLAIRGGLEGYSDSGMGFIMSGYFVGFFIGTFVALPLIQRIGHIRTFAFCASIGCGSVLLHALFVDPIAWIFLRIITGISLVVLYTVIESWLNEQTPAAQRGRVFAIYMVVNLVALALAQQLIRLGSAETFTLFALSAILVSFSLLPVTWTRMSQPHVTVVHKVPFKALYKAAPVAMAGSLLSGIAMGAFWGLSAVYAHQIGLDSAGIATFMSCGIIGGALLQYPVGRYSDTHDRRKVLAGVCGAAALAALLLAALSMSGQWVLLAIGIYGSLAFVIYPITVAHLTDHLDPTHIISGSSGLLLMHGLGAAIGPALAGQFMGILGPQALPLFFAVMQTVLLIFTVTKLRLTEDPPEDHTTHFVPMVRTTPTVLEMLPEEEQEEWDGTDTQPHARDDAA
ncbi:MAG: MFS transporter [Ketobacter sp.]|nr:MAG: MFS transporter [Ketobacter sp.]